MNEFLAGFWVFIGIVAGAIIQYVLGKVQQREIRKAALQMLKTEILINLDACNSLRGRLNYLKDQIGAQQVSDAELYISMQDFDYSSIAPLVNNGLMHTILGPHITQKYFSISRRYNNNSAVISSNMLKSEHSQGKSLAFIKWLSDTLDQDEKFLKSLQDAKIKRGVAKVG